MAEVNIELADHRTDFRPGDVVDGMATWSAGDGGRIDSVEVRLFWHTQGKGDRDIRIVETVQFDNPAAQDAQLFSFTLPAGPHSFEGTLISLIWGVEVVVKPGKNSASVQFTVTTDGTPIRLTPVKT